MTTPNIWARRWRASRAKRPASSSAAARPSSRRRIISPADQTLRAEAERIGAYAASSSARRISPSHEEGGRLVYQDEKGLLDLPRPRLVGRHQYINAGTAIAALRAAGFEQFETVGLRGRPDPCGMAGAAAAHRQGPPAGARSRGMRTLARRRPQCRWRPGARGRHGGSERAQRRARSCSSSGCSGPRIRTRFFRNFIGLAREVIAVPISGPDRGASGRGGRVDRGERRA